MRILLVGSGGREHALAWAISASPLVDRLWCAPGNAGIAREAECVPIAADDVDALVAFAETNAVDLVVIGPEAPLVLGLADRLVERGVLAFGPSAAAAEIEGSKGFMKDLCARHDIPTAAYRRFEDADSARAWVRERGVPIVVKADGLAAGKGVTVATTLDEADAAIAAALEEQAFGAAGASIVVEEFMAGEEASYFALVDGTDVVPLASAQDHKRAFDGDRGPNTGGMGAYSPAPAVTAEIEHRILERIVRPTAAALAAEGRPYRGVLYAGLMLSAEGPKVVEFNCRLGDPEAQVLIPRLRSDIVPALVATAEGQLGAFDVRWSDEAALCVVMAARGYPGSYQRGSEIRGLDAAGAVEGVTVFHAGTSREGDRIVAAGGRVLGVTGLGRDVAEARGRAYAAVDRIDWPDGFCRRDIGWRALSQ